jgi:hypothetical protein
MHAEQMPKYAPTCERYSGLEPHPPAQSHPQARRAGRAALHWRTLDSERLPALVVLAFSHGGAARGKPLDERVEVVRQAETQPDPVRRRGHTSVMTRRRTSGLSDRKRAERSGAT